MGLTQKEMATHLACSSNYVGELENGREPGAATSALFDKLEKEVLRGPVPDGARVAMRAARLAKSLSFHGLGKLTGYKPDVLMAVEEGRGQASEKMISAISRALDIPKETLMAGSDPHVERDGLKGTYGAAPNIDTGPGVPTPRYVPLISMAQAGRMTDLDFTDEGYSGEAVLAFGVKDSRAFSVTIIGDSMETKYSEGDIALLYPSWPARNGGLVVAKLRADAGGDVMFKLFSTKDGGKKVVLSSYNPAFPPMEHEREHFQWIYPVASVTHPLKL